MELCTYIISIFAISEFDVPLRISCLYPLFPIFRQGHFPDALSLITLDDFTPKPALVFLGALSLFYLGAGDIYTLIDYTAFVESSFILVSISGLLYLRWKKPNMERPIKVCFISSLT